MIKKVITGAVLCGALVVGANVSTYASPFHLKNPFHKTEKKTDKKTKTVTIEQAQAVALKKFPGTVESSKTDTYKGKSVYWFNIKEKNNAVINVWVDMSGKVIKSEKEKTTSMTGMSKDKKMTDKKTSDKKTKSKKTMTTGSDDSDN